VSNSELIGIWSVDVMYGPGAQSDERIIFTEDGSGWLEFLNWDIIQVETFDWSLSSDNKLNIKGNEVYSMFDPIRSNSDLSLKNLTYLVEIKKTPSGKEMKTITFSDSVILNDNEFGLEKPIVESNYLIDRLKMIEDGYKGNE